MALQIRRGPTADRTGKRFVQGELILDTTLNQVFVGDSTDGGVTGTLGGLPVTAYTDENAVDAIGAALVAGTHQNIAFTYGTTQDGANRIDATVTLDGTYNDVVQDESPQLGGDLDLNEYDVTGTGNINITGTVTATSFNGSVTGDVLGNLTGDVTGDVSGNAGTVTDGIYTSHNFYIGTEQISITRASNAQTLAGVSVGGNAATATKLAATANINGVAFDGSADITVADSTKLPLTGGTISSDLIVSGNLTVNGTTTTISTTNLEIKDKNIVLAKDATDNETADGAGFTVAGASATLLYDGAGDKFVFNKRLDATSFHGAVTGAVTGNVTGNINGVVTGTTGSSLVGTVTGNVTGSVVSAYNATSVILDTSTLTATLTADVTGNLTGGVTATSGNRILVGNGSATIPVIAFDSDGSRDSGFFWGGDGYVNVTSNGVLTASFGPSGAFTTPGIITGLTIKTDTIELNNLASNYVEFTSNVQFSEVVDFTSDVAFFVKPVALLGLEVRTSENASDLFVDLKTDFSTFNQPVQFGRFSTAQRDALTLAGKTPTGTVIFNTTDNQFQGFNNSAWVTLG